MIKTLPLILMLILLGGCSTTPEALRDAPAQSPSLGRVQSAPDRYIGERLRWGGTIVAVTNLPQHSLIEIVARPLDDDGEPRESDRSEGRFIARMKGFVEPTIYTSGRSITVVGRLAGMQQQKLDKMEYRYPLIDVASHHLWPEPEPVEYYDPYWYDPLFYDPWYPYGYPYRHWPYY